MLQGSCCFFFNSMDNTFFHHMWCQSCALWEQSDVHSHFSIISQHYPFNHTLKILLLFFDILAATWQNKVTVCPAKTQISLGICPVWSESSQGTQSLCWFCHVAAHFVFWPLPIIILYHNFSKPLSFVWINLCYSFNSEISHLFLFQLEVVVVEVLL